jgi:hypothetical protein
MHTILSYSIPKMSSSALFSFIRLSFVDFVYFVFNKYFPRPSASIRVLRVPLGEATSSCQRPRRRHESPAHPFPMIPVVPTPISLAGAVLHKKALRILKHLRRGRGSIDWSSIPKLDPGKIFPYPVNPGNYQFSCPYFYQPACYISEIIMKQVYCIILSDHPEIFTGLVPGG